MQAEHFMNSGAFCAGNVQKWREKLNDTRIMCTIWALNVQRTFRAVQKLTY
jgi:hypothetical protein